MPLDMSHIEQAILPTVSARLAGVEIVDCTVTEDLDHDGDKILRVSVTFRSDGRKLDTERVKGLIRHLRHALAKIGEDRFPIMRFQTVEERLETGPAAA